MRSPSVKSLPILRLIVCALVLSLADQVSAICENVTQNKDVTFSTISPRDSSLWVGTASRGLLRVGTTGRVFAYSSLTGHLECDSIVALAFDETGLLWIRDARGDVLTYSTLEGFVPRSEVPDSLKEALSETTTPEAEAPPVCETNDSVIWPWILVVACLLAVIAYLVYCIRKRRAESTTSAIPSPENPVVKPTKGDETAPRKEVATASSESITEVQDFEAKVRDIVENNYTDKDFSVDQMAALLGISRVHLSRKLKALSAASPSDMIKARRMEAAAEMLRSGEKNMAIVAASCGFASAAYFSSAFKAFYGVSPSAFK